MPKVILVDTRDKEIGVCDKILAHEQGRLHRAFSVLVFNSQNELIIQKRASNKYHCGGLWSNTCCSHPEPKKDLKKAAEKRLQEEMGLKCSLFKAFHLIYKASFLNGLTEYEFDHVFIGRTDAVPVINGSEAEQWKYVGLKELDRELIDNENHFTPWLKIILKKIEESDMLYSLIKGMG